MSRNIAITDQLSAYLDQTGQRDHPVLARCRSETATLGRVSGMQIGADQGAFMAFLAKLIGAKRVIEIGVFTGYSSLSVALALPEDGKIVACDVSEEWTGRARGYWKEAGQEHKIDLRLAPATQTLDKLIDAGEAGRFDMAFIDADKTGYDAYYERVLTLLRQGGLILIDNVLWSGGVADPANTSDDTVALRALNTKIKGDERVDMVLLPLGDGIMMARKR